MLQLLCSEWIVRLFLAYLLLAGGATLLRRQRPILATPLDLFYLPGRSEAWPGSWTRYAIPYASMWWQKYGIRIGSVERNEDRIWKKTNGDGLTYV
jgi:hypothetical protein